MKIYLLKYVIQKSFYGKFNIYPEFVIVKRDHCLELINYRIEKNDNSSFKLTSKIDYWNNESLILQGLYANDKFIGEAIANNKIQKIVNNHLAGLNNKIAKAVRMKSDFTKQVIRMCKEVNINIEESGFLNDALNSSKANNNMPVKLNMVTALISDSLASIKQKLGESNE